MNILKHIPFLRTLSLGVGLAMGLVLASKVYFEQSFDDCYTDADRIFYLNEAAVLNGEYGVWAKVPGGVAPKLAKDYAEVEEGTRFFFRDGDKVKLGKTGDFVKVEPVMLADSSFAHILSTPVIAGNMPRTLDIKNQVAISQSLARRLYQGSGDRNAAARELLGKTVCVKDLGDSIAFTIGAVYEDYPLNATWRPEMIYSLESMLTFGMYDGRNDLMGNDMYYGLVKLKTAADSSRVTQRLGKFAEDNFGDYAEQLKKMRFSFSIRPFTDLRSTDTGSRSTLLILGFVAFALLLTSVLNYLLGIVSQSVTRAKEMAVRKCYGAGKRDFYLTMLLEAVVQTVLAVAIAAIVILAFRGTIESLSGSRLEALFTGRPLLLAIAIVLSIVAVITIVPAEIYQRVPVSVAFRSAGAKKHQWKRGLLCVEFVAVAFLLVALATVSMQYQRLVNADLGFDYDNLEIVSLYNNNKQEKRLLMSELRKLPQVADACFATSNPLVGFSGNNIYVKGHEDDAFNCNDGMFVDDHWANVLGLKLTSGTGFSEQSADYSEVIVDQRFIETARKTFGVALHPGDRVMNTAHEGEDGGMTIRGVVENIEIGSFQQTQSSKMLKYRPMIVAYCNPSNSVRNFDFIFIRHKQMDVNSLKAVNSVIERTLSDNVPIYETAESQIRSNYEDAKNTRSIVLLGGLITLLIALTGLIGYTIDEVRQRRKEIAVRRVNGAQMAEVRRMFVRKTMWLAVPSVCVGALLAVVAMERWEQQFAINIGMPWWQALVAVALTLLVIAAVTAFYVQRYAGQNPADSLRTE